MKSLDQYLENEPALVSDEMDNQKVEFYASEVAQKLGYESNEELKKALEGTFEIFSNLNLSAKKNFKQVLRFSKGQMYLDWKLSPLACYFLNLNRTKAPKNKEAKRSPFFEKVINGLVTQV